MAIRLREEVEEYLAVGPLPPHPPDTELTFTTTPTRADAARYEYQKRLMEGFVNWLADNEKLGILRRV